MRRALLLLAILLPATARAGDWVKVKTSQGITVSKRETGGPVVAFRGEGDVDAPLDAVATVIFDNTRATEWIADLKASRIVRWTGKDEFLEYDHAGMPPPFSDRDFVSSVKLETDRENQIVIFRYSPAIDEAVPPVKKYVRGELSSTVFTLTRLDDGHTHVIAEVQCDPKGYVPKWIVNWVQSEWPETTFKNLRRQVAKKDIVVDEYFRDALTR